MDDNSKLAAELEKVTGKAIAKAEHILDLPTDIDNAGLLRAQSSAMQTVLNTQVRVDALRLRAARVDKALEKLLATIQAKEETVPPALRSLDVGSAV